MAASSRHSVAPRKVKMKSWDRQPAQEIRWPPATPRKPASILGTVTDVYPISRQDKRVRKKYMGLWRRWSEPTTRMMAEFSTKVSRWVRKRTKRKRGSCASAKPSKTNSATWLWFAVSGCITEGPHSLVDEDNLGKICEMLD